MVVTRRGRRVFAFLFTATIYSIANAVLPHGAVSQLPPPEPPRTQSSSAFAEVGDSSHTAGGSTSFGAAWGDYDNDGDLDIYVSNLGDTNRLYENNGDGSYTDVSIISNTNDTGNSWGASWGDIDNDGDLDLYVANNGVSRLYENNGDGTFTDIADSSNTADMGDNRCGVWGDYDNDGFLDLYVAVAGGPNHLYHNNGDRTFTDEAATSNTDDTGGGTSAAWGDIDNDGDLDLYVANSIGTNRLYRNDGGGSFTEIGASSHTDDSGDARGVAWGDYDNDGDLDLYLANVGPNHLYMNVGGGVFSDATAASGTGDGGSSTGVAWGDYDNDGDLDLYVGTYSGANKLFQNNGDSTFYGEGGAGVNDGGDAQGVAWGDYDADGDLDLYVANSDGPNRLYRNDSAVPPGNHWLQVHLVGTLSNRSGIGARVSCVTAGQTQIREVSGGSGLTSQDALTVSFGLGTAAVVDTLEVRWPSGIVQTLTSLTADQRTDVTESRVIYVDSSATGADNGSSWADAFVDLQSALAVALPGVEIWVAEGTYKPTTGTDRGATFQLLNGVELYGGFDGTETQRNGRDWSAHVTILSGDIGTEGVTDDNSYHVVTATGTDSTATLDGFSVTLGRADGPFPDNDGGGLYNAGGNATISNVIFSDNYAAYSGGAVYNSASSPKFLNVTLTNNSSLSEGGGMTNTNGSDTKLDGGVFANNTSGVGGGLNNYSSNPTIENTTFIGNSASNGGAMYNWSSSPTIVNVLVAFNAGSNGAGMYNEVSANPTLVNVTFSRNTASSFGGGMSNSLGSNPNLKNTILWDDSAFGSNEIDNSGTSPIISYSLIEGSGGSGGGWNASLGSDAGGNIDADPLFVNEVGGDMRLMPASPAIDAGDTTGLALPTTDLDGNPRVSGGSVDCGAYEFQTVPPPEIVYVDESATGAGDGTSWGDAYVDLQDALSAAVAGDEIWVAVGTYHPTTGSDRSATFQLVSGVAIYGGFAGTESTISERDWMANPTILSGDIGVTSDSTDNSYHVVTGSGADSTAVLDGFKVTEGVADGASDRSGGGIYIASGSPTLTNLTVEGNYAALDGGGIMNDYFGSNPMLKNITISGNTSGYGGGMYCQSGCNTTLINVMFVGNSAVAGNGGGMLNQGNAVLYNVVFSRNVSAYNGGGMVNGNWASPVLTNVTFSGNLAQTVGGGMSNVFSTPTLVNTILWGDSAVSGDDEIHNGESGSPAISYSLVQGSGGSLNWDGSFGADGGGNIDSDPLFVDAGSDNLRLGACNSPAVDAGSDAALEGKDAFDLEGNTRIVAEKVDMGAYELQYSPAPLAVARVDWQATGAGDGSSWGDAFTDLQNALLFADQSCGPVEIWVAEGTYKPTTGSDRTATFQLLNSVALYGGFSATETTREQRDWIANKTTLSGDIGVPTDSTDNSYHVVTGSGVDSTAVLDGFTIANGTAENGYDNGGGMYCDRGSPTIMNVVFSLNHAAGNGGGFCNSGGDPTLLNVEFSQNSAASTGGGMVNLAGRPNMVGLVFSKNSSMLGGGFHNQADDPRITNAVFFENSATNGGGMSNLPSQPELLNATFAGNVSGGGIFNLGGTPKLTNVVLWGDSGGGGVEIYNAGQMAVVSYSLVAGSGGSGAWNSDFGVDGGGNIDADPLFVDQLGGDLRLTLGSPAIDAGDTTGLALPMDDLDGNPRVFGGTVDMGAYEFQAVASLTASPSPVVFAQAAGNDTTCVSVHVANTGVAPMTIDGIFGCGSNPFSVDTTATSHSLAPGDTTTIDVCVMPTGPGPDSCVVTVVSSAVNSPTVIPVRLEVVTAVGSENAPKPFRIVGVVPNPFNPSTKVHFTLPAAMAVTAEIWSVTGERVRVLARDRRFGSGDNYLSWEGRNDQGAPVASGVYFIRVKTRLGTKVARAVLLK